MNFSLNPFWARQQGEYDACVDGFLSLLLIELETHHSWEESLARAVEHTPFPLRPKLENALTRYRQKGMPLDESFERLHQEIQTPLVQRTIGLLRHVNAHGSTPASRDALRKMVEDARTHHRTKWKSFAQKLVLLSLVFIGVSALVPALFLAFVTIGSRFLELSISQTDILLISWGIFPLLDAGVLAMVYWQMPPTPDMEKKIGKKEWVRDIIRVHALASRIKIIQKKFDEMCVRNGVNRGAEGLVYRAVVQGAGLFVLVWTFFLRHPAWDAFWVSLLSAAALGPLLVNAAWVVVKHENDTHTLEQQSADGLRVLASIPHTLSFRDQLSWVAQTSQNPIQKEWATLLARIGAGKNPAEALGDWCSGRASPILDSVRTLLARTYSAGTPFGTPALTLAEEITQHHASLHERRAVLLVEKYTILLAGGLLVPFLLGILAGVVGVLPISSEFTSPQAPALFETALMSMRGYLFLYAILAGLFVGYQDGKPAQSLLYILILLPSAQLAYTLGNWWMSHA